MKFEVAFAKELTLEERCKALPDSDILDAVLGLAKDAIQAFDEAGEPIYFEEAERIELMLILSEFHRRFIAEEKK
jgi:hypothetical protein